MTPQEDPQPPAVVELRLPANGAYAAVVRTTAAGLAARLDFTIDDIEDLRIAVSEASAMVIGEADPGSDLSCAFHLGEREMTLELGVPAADPAEPDYDSFGWQVLSTLATKASATATPGRFTVSLTIASGLRPDSAPPGPA